MSAHMAISSAWAPLHRLCTQLNTTASFLGAQRRLRASSSRHPSLDPYTLPLVTDRGAHIRSSSSQLECGHLSISQLSLLPQNQISVPARLGRTVRGFAVLRGRGRSVRVACLICQKIPRLPIQCFQRPKIEGARRHICTLPGATWDFLSRKHIPLLAPGGS
ncbi:hypothetical protein BV20DRAFT_213795 [Pilatotrama ljubarskyi]|nr:hypothetical protein BV20DRAFT_213795 [Pilatotrama ljubarskyi]